MDLLIFDLDGTLIDSQRDLAEAVNATRAGMGMAPLELATIAKYVGNGAPVLVRRALGETASDEDVNRALAFFLDYYWNHLLVHTVLYDGVRDALEAFHGRNIGMAVLTNKPIRFSEAIVDGLGLRKYFFRVYGGNSFDSKKPDPYGIHRLMEERGAAPSRTLMIGDSAIDIKTARNAGVKACGVTYGFQPETLIAEPPDILVNHMARLIPIVLR
ncbi:MAG: HAD-IA family hydrolase [Bryobacterales bacterium]|nr:HAD-IA family hydrolase [Bryobacterales bacterium]